MRRMEGKSGEREKRRKMNGKKGKSRRRKEQKVAEEK